MNLGITRVAMAILCAAGCAPAYEPGCPPPTRLQVAPAPTLSSGTFHLTVVDSAQQVVMPQVSVFVDRDSTRRLATDSAGQLVWSGVAPGRHTLSARHIGYKALNEAVRIPTQGGLAIRAALAAAQVDGPCSGLTVPVKVPRPGVP